MFKDFAEIHSVVNDLWIEYFKNNSEQVRIQIIEEYIPLVRKVSLSRKNDSHICTGDDIVSSGMMALVDCFNRFNPNHEDPENYSKQFMGFLMPRISGSVIDEYRKFGWGNKKEQIYPVQINEETMEWEDFIEEDEPDSYMYNLIFKEDFFEIGDDARDVLNSFAHGLSDETTAHNLGITVRKVQDRRKRAFYKIRENLSLVYSISGVMLYN